MEEVRICRMCGYQRGFHVSFRFENNGQRILLICPGCGQTYDLGWIVNGLQGNPVAGRRLE